MSGLSLKWIFGRNLKNKRCMDVDFPHPIQQIVVVQNNNEDPIEYLFHISYENIKVVIVMHQLKINLLKTKDLTELSENEHFSSKIFILFE